MACVDDLSLVVSVFVMLMGGCGLCVPAGPPKHPDSETRNYDGRSELKIRFRCFRIPVASIFERDGCKRPDNKRVRESRGESKQGGLPDCATNSHDKGSHHGFGMPRLKPVQDAEKNCAGNEKPRVRRSLGKCLGEIGHGVDYAP